MKNILHIKALNLWPKEREREKEINTKSIEKNINNTILGA